MNMKETQQVFQNKFVFKKNYYYIKIKNKSYE